MLVTILIVAVLSPIAAALFAASSTLTVRAVIGEILGLPRLVIETRPLNCNLCMCFWSCFTFALGLTVAALALHEPWLAVAAFLGALSGLAPAMLLLKLFGPAPVAIGAALELPAPLSAEE